jgi:hypothetical protein
MFITDGVMLLQEILKETKYKKAAWCFAEIDFERAYDRVNWDFLSDYCRHKGFSKSWLI